MTLLSMLDRFEQAADATLTRACAYLSVHPWQVCAGIVAWCVVAGRIWP